MQAWPAPTIPVLPGQGPQLRLYDSADRQIRTFDETGGNLQAVVDQLIRETEEGVIAR